MNTIPTQLTIVKYDRSARQWQAINGRTWAWPAGQEGKREAQLYALEHDCPAIAAEVNAIIANNQNHPQAEAITRRAIKAGFLIRDGHMLPPRRLEESGSYAGEVARVSSQSKDDIEYAIVISPEQQSYCDCLDWDNGHKLDILADYYRHHPDDPERPRSGAPKLTNGDYGCKHILAYLISAAREATS